VKARRGSRLTAITCGGAIPETGLFTVIVEPQEVMVGTLDEDFAVESNRGDIILLGTTSWQIKRIESARGRVIVEDAHAAPPSVPFWRGEAPARSKELSHFVSELRQKIADMLTANDSSRAIAWLQKEGGLDVSGAEQLVNYIREGQTVLGAVPTQDTFIAERFFDEAGGMQLIIHAPLGARINKAWGLALRKCFCRSFNFELQAAATDDGLTISLAEQHSFPLADVFQFLSPQSIKQVLTQAVLQSPLFTTRFRWTATRALALVRFRHGKKVPPNIQRMLADDLLAAVFPDAAACQDNLGGRDIELPDHPLIHETMKDVLSSALDLEGLIAVLHGIRQGKIRCLSVDTPIPSLFSHEILNANPYAFLDDAPLEERRARAVEMRRVLPDSVLQEVGKLDSQAVIDVQQEAWPDIRNSDELHDLLQTLIAYPVAQDEPWQRYFAELKVAGRVGLASYQDKQFWLAVEKVKTFMAIYPEAILQQTLIEIEQPTPGQEEAILIMLRGWLMHLGPTTNNEFRERLGLSTAEIETALLKLESTGFILRGHFRSLSNGTEWCERRLLARIHRRTQGRLRKEIAPVTARDFMRFLANWQHITSETKLRGELGLLEIIKQLQGFELPANAWESQIFAKRMQDYDPDMLDRLCLMGVIGWGRISPHAALLQEGALLTNRSDSLPNKRRVIPTSITPMTFFVREESQWMKRQHSPIDGNLKGLSAIAKAIHAYLNTRGASFFTDIVHGVGHLKTEVENGLWELVAAGLVSADGFDNLRALIDPRRRLHKSARRRGRFHRERVSHSSGRWALLHTDEFVNDSERIEAASFLLLKRYGVIFRDLLAREKNMPRWHELLPVLRRLEDRGEIRGGRFVSDFRGEQFALPYAVSSLRAMRKEKYAREEVANQQVSDHEQLKQPANLANEALTISAVDPLNLVGIILPGERVSAISGKMVILLSH
jgi:ATP-dependent Lhr-like helicase